MAKRMIIMLLLAGLVLGGLYGFQTFKAKMIQQAMAAFKSPPQTVSTMVAAEQDWQPKLQAVGSLRALNGADLAMEVSGIVEKINFTSGQEVKAGTLLLSLKADDDIAKLHSLEATAELASVVYDRDRKQLKIQAVSQATVDADAANLKNARAQVAAQQAAVDKKYLRAPFTGRLGIRNVDVGQYLSAGTSVVTLQALDPLVADFYLPQQALDQIRVGQQVAAKIDTYPGRTFSGEIAAINPKVDVASRNVMVRATLKNPDHRLLPGMYATLDIATGDTRRYVTLPQTAVTYNPFGTTVYLAESEGKGPGGREQLVAQQAFVTTGPTRGDQVAILKGVKPGQTVVTAGQIKLHNGAPLLINNSVQPLAGAAPTPTE